MCTLTYLPLSEEQYLLTTNRDESPDRGQSGFPSYHHVEGKNIIFPQDPKAGGTWVATSDNGISVCLLNGANEPHELKPPYRISRGLVVMEAIECIKPDEFFKNYDFTGIEPFTMVVLFHDPVLKILEFKWDGENTFLEEKDPRKPHLWASAQLYTKKSIQDRQQWFEKWLKKHSDYSIESIMEFHRNAGSGDLKNDMVMDRGIVKTVSITNISSLKGIINMTHSNLLQNSSQQISLSQHVNQEFSHHIL
ncbi:Transport and Golgi organisation 2 [Marivirga sericea]|uniref:Transport and Golgi organisation 2 n=1 Tax=Marivirga sericea TaxID=1028 RepID=A0A1X7K0E7_9BACT|nr:NRDE family protein [Marivirga sericea]SMG34079.1 Transport and Golgi organisation 2 [Marivirga sericea]